MILMEIQYNIIPFVFLNIRRSVPLTIQMKPLQQYFCMAPFVFNILQNEVSEFS